ncbi:MAG TPA: lanthionine synthetase LanC family protein, partial [Baekduia sp.]|nr:lanthionine synthetase LanC family protein [Baekduia sp.]
MGTLTLTDTTRLRRAAGRGADILVANAITADDQTTWLAATIERVGDGHQTIHRTGDPTLYDGSAGIALACWSAAATLDRTDLADLALRAARHAIASADRVPRTGLFDGTTGIALTALDLGARADDRHLHASGSALLDRVATTPPCATDLVSGSAGIVLALLAAARAAESDRWLTAAARHGERLLAETARYGLSGDGEAPLCGLAHGAAGVAWALGALAEETGDERFGEAVGVARAYERSWFQPVRSGWPDLRPEGGPAVCPALWCHGATGIGLGRLALYRRAAHP